MNLGPSIHYIPHYLLKAMLSSAYAGGRSVDDILLIYSNALRSCDQQLASMLHAVAIAAKDPNTTFEQAAQSVYDIYSQYEGS